MARISEKWKFDTKSNTSCQGTNFEIALKIFQKEDCFKDSEDSLRWMENDHWLSGIKDKMNVSESE